MIEITRAQARQFRAVLPKSTPADSRRGYRPPLVLQAGRDGLRLRAHPPEVAVQYQVSGPRPSEVIALPGAALDDFEGSKEAVVTLESTSPNTVQARWDDGGVPQVRDYPVTDPEHGPPFPNAPTKLTELRPEFLAALHHASHTAAHESVRYAIQKVQLRGDRGELIASDGHQLLIQGGFSFPWKGDVLVPPLAILGGRELPQDLPVGIGKTDTDVCLRIGPWTFFLAIDKEGRYPNVEHIIPAPSSGATTGRLAPEDAAVLAQALPRLPGRADENAPVTLDLNGHIAVRARGESQSRATEIVLSRSVVAGPPVRLVSNRLYLARAVQLGFTEFQVTQPDVPVVCREAHRTYTWMPLGKAGALAPDPDALRIASQAEAQPPSPLTHRRKVAMSTPATNGHGKGRAAPPHEAVSADEPTPNGKGLGALIQEAQALKDALRDAYGRSNRLLVALKHHRKQSKLVQTTLASLRQLQQIDG